MENCYYEREKEKMYGLLPREVRQLIPYVEKECDRLEYNGSRMFDEYPDAYMMERMCDRIGGQAGRQYHCSKAVISVLVGFECYSRRCREHTGRHNW